MNEPMIARDGEGNLYELVGRNWLYGDTLGNIDTAKGAAAAANVTLASDSTARWVVDVARAVVASIAANTTVTVTLDAGADTYVFPLSTNGIHDLLSNNLSKISVLGDAATAVTMESSSGGTGSSVTLVLAGHKVRTADV